LTSFDDGSHPRDEEDAGMCSWIYKVLYARLQQTVRVLNFTVSNVVIKRHAAYARNFCDLFSIIRLNFRRNRYTFEIHLSTVEIDCALIRTFIIFSVKV